MNVVEFGDLKDYACKDLTAVTLGRYVREVVITGPIDFAVRNASELSLTLHSKRADSLSKVLTEFDGESLQVATQMVTITQRHGSTVQHIVGNNLIVAGGDIYLGGKLLSTSLDGDHWVLVLAAPGPIEALQLKGSGDASLRDFSAQRLSLTVTGSGDIEASGEVAELEVSVMGSGDVDARDLRARHVRLNVMGSGDIVAQASESADAKVLGSGDIRIYGDPGKRSQIVLGSGSIKFK